MIKSKRNLTRAITIAGLILFAVLFVGVGGAPAGLPIADAEKLHLERLPNSVKAPDFTLTDLEGNKVSLNSYRGKPLLLYFWATW